MTDIAEWLASLDLVQYAQTFAENGVDLSVVRDLTDDDLKELGVLLGHRRKLLRAAANIAPKEPAPAMKPETASRPEAERRLLSVMFCDLVGSTALTARLDPEDMRDVMATYHSCIAEVLGRFNGMIARYMGDGVLAYFGYPQAREDDAEEAVRAGLTVIEEVRKIQDPDGVALQARVGIATGIVIVGDLLGTGLAQEQAVVGETPNLASRLQARADPGTVLICANTRSLTTGHFNYQDLGPVTLKGWTQAIPIWQVLGATDVESRFEARHRSKSAPLIGRDEELQLVLRRWRQAAGGEGRVIVVTGEAGIGKSHLTLALQEGLHGEPHTPIRYFCSPHYSNTALHPFITQLARSANFQRDDTGTQKLAKLDVLVREFTNDADEIVALFASLLSLPPDPRYPLSSLTPQKIKEKTLAALAAQFVGIAARQAVLAIFEDAHWIDPTSRELLVQIIDQVAHLPVLLIITARPEFVPSWPGYPHITTLPLNRLDRKSGTALIAHAAGGKLLPDHVIAEILARTDGIPLFVEELTKTMIEIGLLQEQQGEYVLDQPLPSLAIPTTLQASLMARLDRLAPVKEVAQMGAVIGREFSYELVSAIAGMPDERLEDALDQLAQSELVFRRGEIPHAVFTFKHTLVRDAAYASILKTRRAQVHASIANVLEQHFEEITKAQPETLGLHLTEAGLPERAAHYWLRAGKVAALRSANIEAIAHLQRGLDCVSLLPESGTRDRLELDFQFALGPCLIATQGPASAKAVVTFSRARELCERLGDPPEYLRVLFWTTTASVIRGELPKAHEQIIPLIRLAQAREDRPAMLNAMRGYGMILLFMGRIVEARDALQRAVEAFDASSDADQLAARAAGQDAGVANLALTSWTQWILGQVDEAAKSITSALHRAELVHDPHTQAYATYYASVLHALRGEPAIGRAHAERCHALSKEHGFRQWLGLSGAVRAICAAAIDPDGALDEAVEIFSEYRAIGYQLGITALAVLLCAELLSKNKADVALQIIEHSLAVSSGNSERIFEAELYRLKARALLAGDRSGAEIKRLLEHAIDVARAQQARSLELRSATDLAVLHMSMGRRNSARELLGPVDAMFSSATESPDLKAARSVLERASS